MLKVETKRKGKWMRRREKKWNNEWRGRKKNESIKRKKLKESWPGIKENRKKIGVKWGGIWMHKFQKKKKNLKLTKYPSCYMFNLQSKVKFIIITSYIRSSPQKVIGFIEKIEE